MDTMVKIVFRKNLNLWEALTAASYKGENMKKSENIKQHIVRTGKSIHRFKETNDVSQIQLGGIELNGQADTVEDFVKNMRLETEWTPFGYRLETIYRSPDSKNMTAYLYKQ